MSQYESDARQALNQQRQADPLGTQIKKRWPAPYAPTEAQLKELDGIKDLPARLTRFRQMQAEAEQAPAAHGEQEGPEV